MMNLFKTYLSILVFTLLVCTCQNEKKINQGEQLYICPPCTCEAHETNQTFEHDGTCPHCGMNLIEKIDSTQVNQIDLKTGAGNFLIEGGAGHKEKTITVFYHKPNNFSPQSSILIVVPGSGRNADEYRDVWIDASEKHNLLILSPRYPEESYGFDLYHMGGLMYDMNIYDHVKEAEHSNEVFLDEETFTFKVNTDSDQWIFNDFDRLFNMVVDSMHSSQTGYDIFGHSAGGQILHRFVLFQPKSKANRILASNSGFYTLPDLNTTLPFGLKNTPVNKESLKNSYSQRLVLFVGEEDDEDETGGILLRSPTVDKQGSHRLERGKYFYQKAKAAADNLETEFNWKLKIIPNVGHDYERMSEASAEYLYEVSE